MVSVIIPARNEEALIERALRSLLDGNDSSAMEVIVCCNGCSDRTVQIARGFEPRVRVVEIERSSKTGALNAGDELATGFPRIYMDADIEMSRDAVTSIVEALERPGVLAVAPKMRVNLTGSGYLVRAFYDIWLRLPYHREGMIGSGVYALSERGRERFGQFPDLIADDGFVRMHFAASERLSLDDCTFEVTSPKTISSLIRIKTRSALGNLHLREYSCSSMPRASRLDDSTSYARAYLDLIVRPRLWPKLIVYTAVQIISRARAKGQFEQLRRYRWERDETSRNRHES